MSAQDVIDAARSCLGTRFQHQGRQPGVGLDCAGVVICAYRAAGLVAWDESGYSRLPNPELMREVIARTLVPVTDAWRPADMLFMRFGGEPQHVGLWTGQTVIHSYLQMRKVVEHRIDARWRARIVAVYRHPGLV